MTHHELKNDAPLAAPAAAATEQGIPDELNELEASIAQMEEWLKTDGYEPLTVSQRESVSLILHELKRLLDRSSLATPAGAAPVLTDEMIVEALHSCAIDTRPSKYGFDALQIDGASVPSLREVFNKLIARLSNAAPVTTSDEMPIIEVAYNDGDASGPFTRVIPATSVIRTPDGYSVFIDLPAPVTAEPVAQCTNSDTWNCKYCHKTADCAALKDARNFGKAAAPVSIQPAATDSDAIRNEAQPVAVVDAGEEGLFVEILYGENGSPLRVGDKLYLAQPAATGAQQGDKA